ncbi:MAG: diaminopimelate epimerase [Ferrimicrobium sp.]
MGQGVEAWKFEGLGNDFVVVASEGWWQLEPAQIPLILDRRRGVGGDGLIEVLMGPVPTMRLYNSDGGRAEMSGNGLRCLGHYLCGVAADATEVTVATDVGMRRYRLQSLEGPIAIGETSMGVAHLVRHDEVGSWVDVGNPHCVITCDSVEELNDLDLEPQGQALQAEVPGGVNVEWVVVENASRLRLRVYERGVGETQACGTGSTAAAVALWRSGMLKEGPVEVVNPGGTLIVSIDPDTGEAMLGGPSALVARLQLMQVGSEAAARS